MSDNRSKGDQSPVPRLPPVGRQIVADGPISGAIAACIAAGVWWLREHPKAHFRLFGRPVTDAELMASIAPACAFAASHGMEALTGDRIGMRVRMVPTVATEDAIEGAIDVATRAVTDAAARPATDDVTQSAIDAAVGAATRAATRARTETAIEAATRAVSRAVLRRAIDAATRAAIHTATQAAIDVATRAATDTTRAATDTSRAALNTTRTAPDDTSRVRQRLSAVVGFLVLCTRSWLVEFQAGNQSSGRSANLPFPRAARPPFDDTRWRQFEAAAKVGPRFLHDRFWIACASPEHPQVDEQGRPHCATGPSHSWPDGFAVWHWHGVRVRRAWIEDPKRISAKLALTWTNLEQRRALAEIIGWTRVLERLRSRVVDQDPDPEIGTLLEVDLPDAGRQRFLQVRCPTGRTFALPMPQWIETARAGHAWSYGISESEHRKLALRT